MKTPKNCTDDLYGDIGCNLARLHAAIDQRGEGDKRIEMGAGYGAQCGDQYHQYRPRRDGVAEQGNGGISAGKLGCHDAGADNGCEQEGGAQTFSGKFAEHGRSILGLADLIKTVLEGEPVQGSKRQAHENGDAVVEPAIGIGEGGAFFGLGAFHFGGIGNAPMGRHGVARPYGAGFRRGVIAHGKDEIKLGGIFVSKFIPGF